MMRNVWKSLTAVILGAAVLFAAGSHEASGQEICAGYRNRPAGAAFDRGAVRDSGAVLTGNVFGTDQLQIVDEEHRRQFPFSAVVAIRAQFDGGSGQSTGFLIGRNTILTCGHCVYDPEYGGLCSGLEFYPGSDNESRPFGTFYASPDQISVHPVWLASAQNAGTGEDWYTYTDHGFDMAVIRLSDSVGDMTGWFGLKWQEGSLNGVPATLTGYPMGYRMKTANGIIMQTEQESLVYRIDTEPGTSGCPIYVESRDGSLVVVGVNKSHSTFSNEAALVTSEKYDWILSQAAPGDAAVIEQGAQAGTSSAGDFSMADFREDLYQGEWKEVVTGYQAYIPAGWAEAGTDADHVYSVSDEDAELFMAISTADASVSSMAEDLLEILKNSESMDPLKIMSSSGAIMDFFMDLNNWGDLTGSAVNDIVINGIEAKTNSMYVNDIFLQAIRFTDDSGNGICLIAGDLSDGKLSPVVNNILDSFHEEGA